MMKWEDYFIYEKRTGKLYWRYPRKGTAAGTEAGSVHKGTGYRVVMVEGRSYHTHRIIWDMVNPNDTLKSHEQIDHIDHDRLNNVVDNLRKVDPSGNSRNRSRYSFNKSGVTGVRFDDARDKWRAEIWVDGRTKQLGRFDSFEEAADARINAEKFYGFHENHGK